MADKEIKIRWDPIFGTAIFGKDYLYLKFCGRLYRIPYPENPLDIFQSIELKTFPRDPAPKKLHRRYIARKRGTYADNKTS